VWVSEQIEGKNYRSKYLHDTSVYKDKKMTNGTKTVQQLKRFKANKLT